MPSSHRKSVMRCVALPAPETRGPAPYTMGRVLVACGAQMLNAAGATASKSVDVKNIVKRDNAGAGGGGAAMTARTTTRTGGEVEEKGSEVDAQHTDAAEATPARRRGPLVQEDGPRGTMVADDDDGSDWEDDADVPPLE